MAVKGTRTIGCFILLQPMLGEFVIKNKYLSGAAGGRRLPICLEPSTPLCFLSLHEAWGLT